MLPSNRVSIHAFRLGLLVFALGFTICQSSQARAQASNDDGLVRAPQGQAVTVPPSHGPRAQQQLQTVILKLAGDPVAVVRSRTLGKHIPLAQAKAIETNLRAQQDALVPAIQARGVQVLAKLQYAINGIKVRGTPAQIASVAKLPGVVAVKPIRTYYLDNVRSVPFIGAPAVWAGPPGLHGENIKVAIIDTGIDYTHANFGGPGTVAAYNAAKATNTQPADPALFGPAAPKVKGGTDLVGDNYNANSSDPAINTPVPDPNPLDCSTLSGFSGHGSHVAGTAAGFGVTSAGATYNGPYDSTTPGMSFNIGPGVAPLADVYSVRVFGCSGSTNVVVEALDWAVQNGMQVVNMSLGSSFGTKDTADAEAAQNAAEAGIVVVASAGNSGAVTYITGSPATADKVISVAAMETVTAANLTLDTGQTVVAQNSNAAPFTNGSALNIVVLRNPDNSISLGCSEAEYVDAVITGKLVVTLRGTCGRIVRAQFGQAHGAAAVAMINNAAGYPVYEGVIPAVSIPFFGIRGGPATDGTLLAAAASSTLTSTPVSNLGITTLASFSSLGPRSGDGHLKPDISAPGVSITSTASGTGNGSEVLSGTSMAAPHVAGVAALALQAHPTWSPDDVRIGMVNTADASQIPGYFAQLGGNGLVQPLPASQSSVVARGDNDAPSLSLGVQQFSQDFAGGGDLTLNNNGASDAAFNISVVQEAASNSRAHTVTVDPSVTVPASGSATVHVGVSIPAATAGDSAAFRQVAGRIVLTPASGADNGGVALSVPYYAVPRVRSVISSAVDPGFTPTNGTTAHVSNTSAVTGTAAFYDWGLSGTHSNFGEAGLRAVGAQGFTSGGNQVIRFAVNTFAPWSYAGAGNLEFDIHIAGPDGNHYTVFSEDFGLATASAYNGQVASIVVNDVTHAGFIDFLATAPTDGTTILLPILASRVGVSAANPRFTYTVESFHATDTGLDNDVIAGPAIFNAFTNAITSSVLTQTVAAGGAANVPLTVNAAEFAQTPALGEMIVARDNFSGATQAQLVPILQSIAVTPASPSILLNQTQQFTATGTFSDNSTADVTTSATWTSSDQTLAMLGTNTGLASPAAVGGPVTITATLGGVSGTAQLTVNPFATSVALNSDVNPSQFGQSVTFTAAVSTVPPGGDVPSGSVTFKDSGSVVDTVALTNGAAMLATSAFSVGNHSITAEYGGDPNNTGSVSNTVVQVAGQAATTTTVASSQNPSIVGDSVTFTATLAVLAPGAGTPTGNVHFMDGATLIGTAALAGNTATLATAALTVGDHAITAAYGGDGNFIASTSGALTQTVAMATTTVELDISVRPPDHAIFREPVTYTATVHGPAGVAQVPTGTVTFTDGSTEVATVDLDSSGQAAFVAKHLTIGLHVITAVYNGDAGFTGSTSASSSFQQSPSPRRRPH